MADIIIECPACYRDTVITERMLRSGIKHSKDIGAILVWCADHCCRVIRVPVAVPTEDSEFSKWIQNESENPADMMKCVPMIDATQARTPTGSTGDLGVLRYQPGGGGPALDKWAYMVAYGINPECHLAKNPGMGGKPFDITGIGKR